MKKSLVVLLVAGVVTLAGVAGAGAQSTAAALVKVPFKFIVGERVLPAGTYRISAQTPDAGILLVSNVAQTGVSAMVVTQAQTNAAAEGPVHVTFTNFDGQYFLSTVSMPGESPHAVTLSKTSAEQILAKLNLMPAQRADTAAK